MKVSRRQTLRGELDGSAVVVLVAVLTQAHHQHGRGQQHAADAERRAFIARPQVAELAVTPYEVLLDAGIESARNGTLPLERWLVAVQTIRPRVGS